MSIVKKSDVKNHLSARHRTQIHLCQPESQPDATGFSAAESGAAESGPSIFTEDFLAEHSSSRKPVAPASCTAGAAASQANAAAKSVQP